MQHYSIAIDGPAGSGKSTVAKLIAKDLGFTYIDTGAMYRAITLKALDLGINLENEEEYKFIENTNLEFVDGLLHMDGVDVSKEIRTERIVLNVSLVSSLKYVREQLVALQRKMAESVSVVMDGRDIGTNVLTNATLKIFLIASAEERAKRRYKEQIEKGMTGMSYEDVLKDLERRDTYDSTRKHNPLRQAEDAIKIDSSNLTIKETEETIIHYFKEIKHE